jgi:DNA-binding transcriptional MerR regulator
MVSMVERGRDIRDGVTVGAAAELVGVTVRTLHHWDEIGLASPSVRTTAGYRQYTDADLQRLHRIVAYREAGLGLDAVREVLDDQTGRSAPPCVSSVPSSPSASRTCSSSTSAWNG